MVSDPYTTYTGRGGGHLSALPVTALKPTLVRMSTVEPKRIEWISRGRLAVGKLTVLDGDPGLGKSSIALDFAARITRGEALPDGEPSEPRGVVLISDEDDDADTISPRLTAAGANQELIYRLKMLDVEGNYQLPEFPRDGEALLDSVREVNAALVIIDPLMLYMGADVNANRDTDVRRALAPIIRAAQETGAAVLVLRHLNKGGGGNALYRGGGSIGIVGAARFGLIVARDPDDETGATGVLAPTKVNLGPPPPSLKYQLQGVPGTDVARIEWLGESHHRAGTLLEMPGTEAERDEQTDAEKFLRSVLEEDGELTVKDLKRAANEAGVSWRSVERAKSRLKVITKREGFGANGSWKWSLPEKPAPLPHRLPTPVLYHPHTPPPNPEPKNRVTTPVSSIERHTPPYTPPKGIWVCRGCGKPRSRSTDPCPTCGWTEGEER